MKRKYVHQISSEEMKEYGEFFKLMRKSIGLTQTAFGEELGVFFTTVYRWENGLRIPKKDIHEIEYKVREIVKRYRKVS
jgi:DNA-binding transcriptional regulator YiaG